MQRHKVGLWQVGNVSLPSYRLSCSLFTKSWEAQVWHGLAISHPFAQVSALWRKKWSFFHRVQNPAGCYQWHYISLKSPPKCYACARGNNHVALTTAQNKARPVYTECVGWLSSAQRCRTKHWPLCCCRCYWWLLQLHPSCPQQRRSPLGFLLPFPQDSPNQLQETNPFYIRSGSQKLLTTSISTGIISPSPHFSLLHPIHIPIWQGTQLELLLSQNYLQVDWTVGCLQRDMNNLGIFYSAGAQFSLSFM